MDELLKRRHSVLIKKIWSCEKCNTLKSCAVVILVGTAMAVALIMIRLVGEKRFQQFLNGTLFFRRSQRNQDLASGAFVSENRI
jgi:hypothetical protein